MKKYHSLPTICFTLFLALTTIFFLAPEDSKGKLQEEEAIQSVQNADELFYWLGSNSIVRNSETNIDVINEKKLVYRVEKTITILNETGTEFGNIAIPYNSFMKPQKIKGEIRDKNDEQLRKLSSKEIKDYSNSSSYSLYEDSRVLFFQLLHNEYPYTISYEYEVEYDGYINWPMWFPQDYGMSVDYAGLVLTVPSGMEVRYRMSNMTSEPVILNDEKNDSYTWELVGLAPVKTEPYGPKNYMQMPFVELAPNQFHIDGYDGMLKTWKSFGRWYSDLSSERDNLPDETVEHLRDLVDDIIDEDEKIKKLYTYLQESTRYVNISLGLGGWQTYPATYVQEKGYGDCKALTNYMIAMLKTIGVDAYPALIRSGVNEREIDPEFPSNQFNHVIAFIPRENDDLWLECTSKTMPFGEIGLANEDRLALVVKSDGGELIRTPKANWHENGQYRNALVKIDENGSAKAIVNTRFTGNQNNEIRGRLYQKSERDKKLWLEDWIDIPSFTITTADFNELDSKDFDFQLPMELIIPNFAAIMGSRMFVNANLMERNSILFPEAESRTQPVHLNFSWVDVDTVYYEIPSIFFVESLSDPIIIEPEFGYYSSKLEQTDEKRVLYTRELQIHQERFDPEQYDRVKEFFNEVVKADQMKFLLKKR